MNEAQFRHFEEYSLRSVSDVQQRQQHDDDDDKDYDG